MTQVTNIQQILSNISSVEKVQQVQQHQAQTEQSRLVSQQQKVAENSGKKIDNAEPSDRVEISIKGDQQGMKREHEKKEKRKKEEGESGDNVRHIDIRV